MSLSWDDSQWPLVVDVFSQQPTDDDIRDYNARRAERLARAERHAQLIDGRAGVRMSRRHRRIIAAFDAQNRKSQKRYLAGVALVTTSPVLRIVLQTIYRLTPSVCPRKPCESVAEANSWAQGLLRDSPALR